MKYCYWYSLVEVFLQVSRSILRINPDSRYFSRHKHNHCPLLGYTPFYFYVGYYSQLYIYCTFNTLSFLVPNFILTSMGQPQKKYHKISMFGDAAHNDYYSRAIMLGDASSSIIGLDSCTSMCFLSYMLCPVSTGKLNQGQRIRGGG